MNMMITKKNINQLCLTFCLLFIICLFNCKSVHAATPAKNDVFTVKGIKYCVTKVSTKETCGKVEIVGYTNDLSKDITIPSQVRYNKKSYNVIRIGIKAFENSKIESVKFSGSPIELYSEAFADCKKLKYVEISNVTLFSLQVFSNCTKLENVVIGNGIDRIPNKTFEKCKSLKHINLPDGILYIGKKAFNGCSSLSGDLVIPKSVVSIIGDSFSGTGVNLVIPKYASYEERLDKSKISYKYSNDSCFIITPYTADGKSLYAMNNMDRDVAYISGKIIYYDSVNDIVGESTVENIQRVAMGKGDIFSININKELEYDHYKIYFTYSANPNFKRCSEYLKAEFIQEEYNNKLVVTSTYGNKIKFAYINVMFYKDGLIVDCRTFINQQPIYKGTTDIYSDASLAIQEYDNYVVTVSAYR